MHAKGAEGHVEDSIGRGIASDGEHEGQPALDQVQALRAVGGKVRHQQAAGLPFSLLQLFPAWHRCC